MKTAKEFLIENGLDSELADSPEVLELLESNLEAFAKQQREQYFEELFGDTPYIVKLKARAAGRNFYKKKLENCLKEQAINEVQYNFLLRLDRLKILKTESGLLCERPIPRKFTIDLYTKR